MRLLNNLEKKFGKYAISGLMKYIVMLNIAGVFVGLLGSNIYAMYFSLDMESILHGQVWRLFTFILGSGIDFSNPTSIIFFAIEMYVYYLIGNTLENVWGAFRFNMYYLLGIILNILAAVIIYVTRGEPFFVGLDYINQSMFLAIAALFPNMQFLLSFVLPIKAKWLGMAYGAYWLYDIVSKLANKQYGYAVAMIFAMANFLIFFLYTRNYKRFSPSQHKRKARFRKQVQSATGLSRHKCAICGRTEEDNDRLEFRFCSKCDGNYEYCSEHLFTHEHVHKN